MFAALQDKLFNNSKVSGIEVIILKDNSYLFNLITLSIKKNIVTIDYRQNNINGIENLQGKIIENIPVALVINGRGILHKKSTLDNIQSILLDAQPNDFYFQSYEGEDDFISIIRKNTVDDLIKTFKLIKATVISVSLGPFSISNILPLIENLEKHLTIGGHQLEINGGIIKNYSFQEKDSNEQDLKIGQQNLKTDLVLAYAASFQTIAQISKVELYIETVHNQINEFQHKKIFTLFGWTSMLLFLIILLVNFFLFNHYFNENKIIENQATFFKEKLKKVDSLNKKVSEKEAFLSVSGWISDPKSSYIVDRIASTTPQSVKLVSMEFHPFDQKTFKKEKTFSFNTKQLKITGQCNKPTDLNPWLKQMKLFDWIVKLEINNYIVDNKSGMGSFNLNIQLK